MARIRPLQLVKLSLVFVFMFGAPAHSQVQPRRHIKVVLETKQSSTSARLCENSQCNQGTVSGFV